MIALASNSLHMDPSPYYPQSSEQEDAVAHYELHFFDDILNDVGMFIDEAMLLNDSDAVDKPRENRSEFVPVSPEHTKSSSSDATESATRYCVSPTTSTEMNQRQTFTVPNPMSKVYEAPIAKAVSKQTKSRVKIEQALSPIPAPRAPVQQKYDQKVPASTAANKRLFTSISNDGSADEDITESQVIDQRRERNREHAKRSRLRKKSVTSTLEQSAIDLKLENEILRKEVFAKLGQDKAEAILQGKISAPADKFIRQLKEPGNLVVEDATRSFLNDLIKKT